MERYEVIRDLGSGNFGVAKLVRDVGTKDLYAVKFIERGYKVNKLLLRVVPLLLFYTKAKRFGFLLPAWRRWLVAGVRFESVFGRSLTHCTALV